MNLKMMTATRIRLAMHAAAAARTTLKALCPAKYATARVTSGGYEPVIVKVDGHMNERGFYE
jgi:hypothetical protein